jgi:hypothetical protein
VAHQNRAEQADEVASRVQCPVQVCVGRCRTASIAAHIRGDRPISGRRDGLHLAAPRIGGIRKSVAEKNGRPLPLLGDMQRYAVGCDVVRFESVVASRTFRFVPSISGATASTRTPRSPLVKSMPYFGDAEAPARKFDDADAEPLLQLGDAPAELGLRLPESLHGSN